VRQLRQLEPICQGLTFFGFGSDGQGIVSTALTLSTLVFSVMKDVSRTNNSREFIFRRRRRFCFDIVVAVVGGFVFRRIL